MQDLRIETIEQFIAVYPTLFSQKRLQDWRKLFNDSAIMVKVDYQGLTGVANIDAPIPEQEEYAAENDFFEEKWSNIQIHTHGNIAVVIADYVLKGDCEMRKGVDVVTLSHDSQGWKIVSLVYEQTGYKVFE